MKTKALFFLGTSLCILIIAAASKPVPVLEQNDSFADTKVVKRHNKKDHNVREDVDFKWVLCEHKSGKVSAAINKEVIIPESIGADEIKWQKAYFIARGINGHSGLYEIDGREVVSPEMGYADISAMSIWCQGLFCM